MQLLLIKNKKLVFALGIAARKPFCNQKALLRKARRRKDFSHSFEITNTPECPTINLRLKIQKLLVAPNSPVGFIAI